MTNAYARLYKLRQVLAACFALIFLGLVAISWQYEQMNTAFEQLPAANTLFFSLIIIWIVIFINQFGYFLAAKTHFWRHLRQLFWVTLFPPLFLGLTWKTGGKRKIWLGRWRLITARLIRRTQTFFFYLLAILAIPLLPLWLIALFIPSLFTIYPDLYHFYFLGNSIIWGLFVLELILTFGMRPRFSRYFLDHGLDLLILIWPIAVLNRFIKIFNLPQYFSRWQIYLTRMMFFFAVLFLILSAILVQYSQTNQALEFLHFADLFWVILLYLWPVFIAERLLVLVLCNQWNWPKLIFSGLVMVLPPFYLAMRRCDNRNYFFYANKWRLISYHLERHIEKRFVFWILTASVLMIPFWVIEVFFFQFALENLFLIHIISLGNAVVWGLFVAEFIIEISITKKRRRYVFQHWIELLIIILPMFALLRFVRIAHLLRIKQIIRLQSLVLEQINYLRRAFYLYRLRGTVNKIVRIITLVEIIKRFYHKRNPQSYLKQLEEQWAEKKEELNSLEKQIEETKRLIEKKQKQR